MDFPETVLAVGPALAFGFGIGLFRRGRTPFALAVLAASVAVAAIAAATGNARPIVGLLAFGLIVSAFIADESRQRAVALSCFSAGFIALIIAAMYT